LPAELERHESEPASINLPYSVNLRRPVHTEHDRGIAVPGSNQRHRSPGSSVLWVNKMPSGAAAASQRPQRAAAAQPRAIGNAPAIPPCRREDGNMERIQRRLFFRDQPRKSCRTGLSRTRRLPGVMASALCRPWRNQDHRFAL
jgi:hypothetical protein